MRVCRRAAVRAPPSCTPFSLLTFFSPAPLPFVRVPRCLPHSRCNLYLTECAAVVLCSQFVRRSLLAVAFASFSPALFGLRVRVRVRASPRSSSFCSTFLQTHRASSFVPTCLIPLRLVVFSRAPSLCTSSFPTSSLRLLRDLDLVLSCLLACPPASRVHLHSPKWGRLRSRGVLRGDGVARAKAGEDREGAHGANATAQRCVRSCTIAIFFRLCLPLSFAHCGIIPLPLLCLPPSRAAAVQLFGLRRVLTLRRKPSAASLRRHVPHSSCPSPLVLLLSRSTEDTAPYTCRQCATVGNCGEGGGGARKGAGRRTACDDEGGGAMEVRGRKRRCEKRRGAVVPSSALAVAPKCWRRGGANAMCVGRHSVPVAGVGGAGPFSCHTIAAFLPPSYPPLLNPHRFFCFCMSERIGCCRGPPCLPAPLPPSPSSASPTPTPRRVPFSFLSSTALARLPRHVCDGDVARKRKTEQGKTRSQQQHVTLVHTCERNCGDVGEQVASLLRGRRWASLAVRALRLTVQRSARLPLSGLSSVLQVRHHRRGTVPRLRHVPPPLVLLRAVRKRAP